MLQANDAHTSSSDVQPIPFLFDGENLIRCIMILGIPWFVVVDICRVLGIKNAAQAIENLDDDEKGICLTYTLGGPQELLTVSEGGLHTLILRSRAALMRGTAAHKFRKWVTSDLLPSIRKTGRYGTAAIPKGNDLEKLQKVGEVRRLCGVKAALDLWVALGLEIVPSMFSGSAQMEIPLDYGPIPASASIN